MPLDGPIISLRTFTWEDTGSEEDPKSRLLGTLYIDGYALHVEAYAVKEKGGLQEAADPLFEDDLSHYYAATGVDKEFNTLTIEGRDYIIVATPFA